MKDVLAIASDHGGFNLKEDIKTYLADRFEILDLGTHSSESVDYPEFGKAMGEAITDGRARRGILVCGSGIGISIAANRFSAVRAALCMNTTMARLAREHNDANVLCLGERLVGIETALECVEVFLTTEFEGGRHARRVKKLTGL